jgi:predicted ArsR family transcriptional regulator
MTQARLIKLMLPGDLDCKELAEETGLHYVTVLQYARELHLAGAAHICTWRADDRGRHLIKIYKIGEGKDSRRRKKTHAERQRTFRANKAALTAQTAMTLRPKLDELFV